MAGAFDAPGLIDAADRPGVQAAGDAIEARGASVYANSTEAVDGSVVAKAFSGGVLAGLAAIKQEWDPGERLRPQPQRRARRGGRDVVTT